MGKPTSMKEMYLVSFLSCRISLKASFFKVVITVSRRNIHSLFLIYLCKLYEFISSNDKNGSYNLDQLNSSILGTIRFIYLFLAKSLKLIISAILSGKLNSLSSVQICGINYFPLPPAKFFCCPQRNLPKLFTLHQCNLHM